MGLLSSFFKMSDGCKDHWYLDYGRWKVYNVSSVAPSVRGHWYMKYVEAVNALPPATQLSRHTIETLLEEIESSTFVFRCGCKDVQVSFERISEMFDAFASVDIALAAELIQLLGDIFPVTNEYKDAWERMRYGLLRHDTQVQRARLEHLRYHPKGLLFTHVEAHFHGHRNKRRKIE